MAFALVQHLWICFTRSTCSKVKGGSMLTSTHGKYMRWSGECVIAYNKRRALGANGMFNRQRGQSTRSRSRAICMLVLRSPKECHALRCSLAFAILHERILFPTR
eukprot:scaffold227_cov394-Pavlova_lutheri.AAC.1